MHSSNFLYLGLVLLFLLFGSGSSRPHNSAPGEGRKMDFWPSNGATGGSGSDHGPNWDYSWGWGSSPGSGWGYGSGSGHSPNGFGRGFGYGFGYGSGSGSGYGYGTGSGGARGGGYGFGIGSGGGGSGRPSGFDNRSPAIAKDEKNRGKKSQCV